MRDDTGSEDGEPQPLTRTRSRRGRVPGWGHVVALVIVTSMLTAGGTAWASHKFNDVPDSNVFHDDISWLAGTGITKGYGDGGYHPTDPVTRQAMAAFMKRLYNINAGLTASAYVEHPTSPSENRVWTDAGVSVVVTIPAGTTGRILVTMTAQMACNNGDNSPLLFAVTPPACHLRVLDNGSLATLSPDDWIVQTSPDAVVDGDIKADQEAATLQVRSDAVLPAGQHTLKLQGYADDSLTSDGNNKLQMFIGTTVFVAQVVLTDA